MNRPLEYCVNSVIKSRMDNGKKRWYCDITVIGPAGEETNLQARLGGPSHGGAVGKTIKKLEKKGFGFLVHTYGTRIIHASLEEQST